MPKGGAPSSEQFVTLSQQGLNIPAEILMPGIGFLLVSVLGGVMAGTILFEMKDFRDKMKVNFGEPPHLMLPSAGFRKGHGPQ